MSSRIRWLILFSTVFTQLQDLYACLHSCNYFLILYFLSAQVILSIPRQAHRKSLRIFPSCSVITHVSQPYRAYASHKRFYEFLFDWFSYFRFEYFRSFVGTCSFGHWNSWYSIIYLLDNYLFCHKYIYPLYKGYNFTCTILTAWWGTTYATSDIDAIR